MRRAGRTASQSWLWSAVIHLTILIAASLVLQPMAGFGPGRVELTVYSPEAGRDLVWMELDDAPPPSLTPTAEHIPAAAEPAPIDVHLASPLTFLTPRDAIAHDILRDAELWRDIGEHPGQATFFGTQASGDRFIYILDVSPSMLARSGERLARAMSELLRSIDQLRSSQRFHVIVFGWETRHMRHGRSSRSDPVPATLENKRQLRGWLQSLETIRGTDPRAALRFSLRQPVDAIFLLSDGNFNQPRRGRDKPGDMPVKVAGIVRGSRVPVHTIAFEDRSSEPGMQEIAELTGGTHRFVPAPETEILPELGRGRQERARAAVRQALEAFRFHEEIARTAGGSEVPTTVPTRHAAQGLKSS